MTDPIAVIHRDMHLLVLDKPSGLATTSPTGEDCLVALAQQMDPQAPRLHPTSRLDAEVTGLVTFARTERATRVLLEARERGDYARRYLAIVTPAPKPPSGAWSQAIAIDRQDPRRRVAREQANAQAQAQSAPSKTDKPARTEYRTLAVAGPFALLCLSPLTGRTHQLRVHSAHAGTPIFGDRHYGGVTRLTSSEGRVWSARRVMLHCAALRIPHPRSGTPLKLHAPVPDDMRTLWQAVGGRVADFGDVESLLAE